MQEKSVANAVRTRAAKKRVAASEQSLHQRHQEPETKKKRVVLGEGGRFPNTLVDLSSDVGVQKRKTILGSKNNEQRLAAKEEIQESHSDDPQMCGAYVSDIYAYLHSMEVEDKRRPMPDYIETIQKDVTAQMRGVLVDWLVEVAQEYKLASDTLYLTVSYLDRFLSSKALNRQKLQLLGVSCMLIASKYEDISAPHVEDFCYITDYTYTKQEMVKMETDILKVLNFEMGNPTAKTFLRRFTRTAQDDSGSPNLQLELLSCYLAELSLLDYACIRYLPSTIAASVIFLTNFTIQPTMHPWSSILQQQSGYKPSDLKECVLAIHDLQSGRKGSALVAVRDKYNQHKFKCVARLTSPSEIPTEFFEDIYCGIP